MMKKSLGYDYHQAIIGLLFSYFIVGLIGNILEVFAGRLRPDFLSVCQPDLALVEQIYNSYNFSHDINYGPRNLFNSSICTGSPKDILNERTSFPSGHSYTSFSLLSYLALYIAGQIHLLDKKSYLWKFVVVLTPYAISIAVAMSRVYDNRHHWEDVTIGGLIGLVSGTLTYFYYYPSLSDPKCDIPYQYRKEDKKNEDKRQEYIEYN